MKLLCLIVLFATAQSASWGSLFQPMQHLGLEPSAEHKTLKSKFLGGADKSSQIVEANSDLSVKSRTTDLKPDLTIQSRGENMSTFEIKPQSNSSLPKTHATQSAKVPNADVKKPSSKPVDAADAKKPSSHPASSTEAPSVADAKKPSSRPASSTEAPRRKTERSFEGNLIHSLRFMGENGEQAVECVTHCRYGEVRNTWSECLEKCVENKLMRSTFMSMLPQEKHDAHAEHVEMPEVLQKKQRRKNQRSSEL
jgi:hypothetical protein